MTRILCAGDTFIRLRRAMLLLAAALAYCGLLPSLPAPVFAAQLRLGDIGKQPAEQTKTFSPFVNYLVSHLRAEGIEQGRVVVMASIPEMGTALREGKVDLFMDSVFPAMAMVRLADAKLLLRRWRYGTAEYRSVIIVRKDSGIRRLDDLIGRIVAFDAPFSTTTYFLPKLALTQKGLKVREIRGPSDKVSADEVGYIFVGDDPNTMTWVLRGKVSAGAVGSERFRSQVGKSIDALQIIHESASFPRQVVGHRSDLPAKLAARIREVLISMDRTEEGKKVLMQLDNTTRFDEIPAHSIADMMRSLPLIDTELGIR